MLELHRFPQQPIPCAASDPAIDKLLAQRRGPAKLNRGVAARRPNHVLRRSRIGVLGQDTQPPADERLVVRCAEFIAKLFQFVAACLCSGAGTWSANLAASVPRRVL